MGINIGGNSINVTFERWSKNIFSVLYYKMKISLKFSYPINILILINSNFQRACLVSRFAHKYPSFSQTSIPARLVKRFILNPSIFQLFK